MKLVVCKDYLDMSQFAAKAVAEAIDKKPNLVLGLPTGSTPVGMYKELVSMNKEGKVDFSKVTTFNLDEYYPIKREDTNSYYYFMMDNIFNHVNIDKANVNIPNGSADDADEEGINYDKKIEEAGGIDFQVLGSGVNGHIGFNEPDAELIAGTHKTSLTENTIEVNSKFFDDISLVPHYAITMGMASILKSKKIIILINGDNKAPILDTIFSGKISTQIPASMLQMHNDVTVITDERTYAKTSL